MSYRQSYLSPHILKYALNILHKMTEYAMPLSDSINTNRTANSLCTSDTYIDTYSYYSVHLRHLKKYLSHKLNRKNYKLKHRHL